jgi:NADH-quinone oxidoreductase subunit L
MPMLETIWLIPALPLAGFIALTAGGGRLAKRCIAVIGAGTVGVSALWAALAALRFLVTPPPGNAFTLHLWRWIDTERFAAEIALYLDPLSLTMMLTIAVVSFLILLYSTEYMADEEGYGRFFAYMDLFVGMMLALVLANNLLLLYLGWEGVGLCSYLLIGFRYHDGANIDAARKAFIVTRIGDAALLIGIALLFTAFGTLDIQAVAGMAAGSWAPGSPVANAGAALILAGALGKSAQIPLQTWLPDAMAGPVPVSALIHAATMVTAGMYLIARMHGLFLLAPMVLAAVGVIGAATLLIASCAALAQTNIKRVLAYSTISQVGYMFLALGVGAFSAAVFHFVTHAFFKSLLFLCAGVVIRNIGHEDMSGMGGLRKTLPLTFWTFLAGAMSLAALPLVTAGFYSKDLILIDAWSARSGIPWFWIAGALGTLLTGLYAFRMVFLTFFGEVRRISVHTPGIRMTAPLVLLAFFSLAVGLIDLPKMAGNAHLLIGFLQTVLPGLTVTEVALPVRVALQSAAALLALLGVFAAYLIFVRKTSLVTALDRIPAAVSIRRFLLAGWGFDALYDRLLVRPFLWAARVNRNDCIDAVFRGIADGAVTAGRALGATQNGDLRRYAAGLALGAIIVIAIGVFA